MNTSKWFGVGIVAVVLIIGAYLIGQNSNNQTPSTNLPSVSNTNTQSAPQSLQVKNQTNPTQTGQSQPKQKSLADIITEWRESTAFIDCTFGNLPDNNLEDIWGSGLLATINSTPTIITNRHVVDNRQNNLDYCTVKFPNENGGGYMINSTDEDISYDSNDYDVAYLTIPQREISLNENLYNSSSSLISNLELNQRSQGGAYSCKNALNIGDPIVIIGYPINGSVSDSNYYKGNIEVTATEGIISGMDGIYYTTSAKVDSGNSGGLAIDETNDCYAGIPTWDESGNFGSLARILPVSTFLHY